MPPSKPYRFHPQAWQEVEEAAEWYGQQNPEASIRFLSILHDGLESISRRPRRWPGYLRSTRRLILFKFPFSIIYREEPFEVSIVAIAHHKRRPEYWKDRL